MQIGTAAGRGFESLRAGHVRAVAVAGTNLSKIGQVVQFLPALRGLAQHLDGRLCCPQQIVVAHRAAQHARLQRLDDGLGRAPPGVDLAHQPIPLGSLGTPVAQDVLPRLVQRSPGDHQPRAQVAALAGSAAGLQPVAQAIPRARHTYCPGALAASPAART